ncbi:D-Ala-D-Ala carboxypeptidase family metallohydrolase [Moraxella marmotae]|uniref:D-Ala-D-Ala carboxypeptidase family metallohydrolase n=1 Tax=Moraxella marmotae TaxID=3344520 RepID=UPI0035F2455E
MKLEKVQANHQNKRYFKSGKRLFWLVGVMAMLTACAAADGVQSPPKPAKLDVQMMSDNADNNQNADRHADHDHSMPNTQSGDVGSVAHFQSWLNNHPEIYDEVMAYQAFLHQQMGSAEAVPPMNQLLTTARAWQECKDEPYQVPPRMLWDKMLPTLRLYRELKQAGILPADTLIRSVYRNPKLNQCAGGAAASKHLTNGAIDIWVPRFADDSAKLHQLQDKLCQYWLEQGERHAFGLGLYATGAIHLDTQGYRKWGGQFSQEGSVCRITLAKPMP